MKKLTSLKNEAFFCFIIFLKFLGLFVKAEEGCPPDEDIRPCVCYNSPFPVLHCSSIQNENILKDVFDHSKGYKYNEVHLEYASLKYLPKEIFTNTKVLELHLVNSTFNFLFDSPPENLQLLRKIYLENTKIIEISHWEMLEHLTHLKILQIYYNFIEKIDSSISHYISKQISQIVLYGTRTKYIMPGAFVDIPSLERLSVDNCRLKEISRDIFPRPSNVKHIYFNNNDLTVIPDDMFVDMPNLKTVGLKENLLVTIPELAFGGNVRRLEWLFLDGNSLKCTCNLRWLINNKPEYLSGSCSTPLRLHDKHLRDLTEKDLKC